LTIVSFTARSCPIPGNYKLRWGTETQTEAETETWDLRLDSVRFGLVR